MTRKEKIQRLEFLHSEQTGVNTLLASNRLFAQKMASLVLELGVDDVPSLTKAIERVELSIDEQRASLLAYLDDNRRNLTQLGVNHFLQDKKGINTIQYYSLTDTIANEFANRRIVKVVKGAPDNFTEEEKRVIGNTGVRGRILDALQDDIEIVFKRQPRTMEGLEYLMYIQQNYPELGQSVNMPLRFYKQELAQAQGLTIEELEGKIKIPRKLEATTATEGLWNVDDRRFIYSTITDGIRAGENSFQIAERLSSGIINNRPRWMIDRLVNTELVGAYYNAKDEIARQVMQDYPEISFVIDIELNPMHPRPDICDVLVGTYTIENAPSCPLHPNCICLRKERMIATKNLKPTRYDTVEGLLEKNKTFIEKKHIHIPDMYGHSLTV